MAPRIIQLYQRKRVVNINVNIFIAGLIAIAIARYPVSVISGLIGHEHRLLISVLSYIIDTTIDIFVYFGLHWLANHWHPMRRLDPDVGGDGGESGAKKFLMDAGRIQAERFVLVPVFFLFATGGMWAMQRFMAVKPDDAFVYAFILAMLVTRVIHTIWGYHSGTFRDRGVAHKDGE